MTTATKDGFTSFQRELFARNPNRPIPGASTEEIERRLRSSVTWLSGIVGLRLALDKDLNTPRYRVVEVQDGVHVGLSPFLRTREISDWIQAAASGARAAQRGMGR